MWNPQRERMRGGASHPEPGVVMARSLHHPATVLAAAAVLVLTALTLAAGRTPARALSNGLALTPPMGWNDWNAYGCNVSEQLVEQTAQFMVTSGMKAAGYDYVNIDDCWPASQRDASGNLVANPAKFPDGIAAVAAYVHSLGLKLGIYEDDGTATCAGFPGSLGHEQQDANTFASWGIDYLKYDNCNNNGNIEASDQAMRNALAATGRPILFSLSEWGQNSVWTWGAQTANAWRTTGDISASFSSMLSNFHSNVALAQYAGPGGWNDPDMLEVGNGMSATEDQSEFSLWAEMAAPLIAGTNLQTASATTMSILTNSSVIAVDQDTLGKQGTEVSSSGGLDVLAKPLAGGATAVVLFNENTAAATISTTAAAAGLPAASSYTLSNLWANTTTSTAGPISASVPGHGVVMYRVTPAGVTSTPTPSVTPTPSPSHSPPPSPSPTPTPTPTPSPTSSTGGALACHVTYATQSQWAGGFVANVTVTNSGTAGINGWTLSFTFPGDQKVTSAWNVAVTQNGENVTAANMAYNAVISPGGNAAFGFQGTWGASDAVPTTFKLNGTACT
jgi:alpha-galactosidase